jgi:hypothetical protein
MFTFTFVDLEYETSVSIWEFEMIIELKWSFCLHLCSLHDLIHRTQMKLRLLIKSVTLICLWKLVFPVGIIEISTTRKTFLLFFRSLHDYWPPNKWNVLVNTSWGEMERCEKRAFQLHKMRKEISRNIKLSK